MFKGDRLDIEHGGKIVLPPSAIEDLASQEFGDVNNFDKPEDTAGFYFWYFYCVIPNLTHF